MIPGKRHWCWAFWKIFWRNTSRVASSSSIREKARHLYGWHLQHSTTHTKIIEIGLKVFNILMHRNFHFTACIKGVVLSIRIIWLLFFKKDSFPAIVWAVCYEQVVVPLWCLVCSPLIPRLSVSHTFLLSLCHPPVFSFTLWSLRLAARQSLPKKNTLQTSNRLRYFLLFNPCVRLLLVRCQHLRALFYFNRRRKDVSHLVFGFERNLLTSGFLSSHENLLETPYLCLTTHCALF